MEKTKLMRGHTQDVRVNEKCGNNFYCACYLKNSSTSSYCPACGGVNTY